MLQRCFKNQDTFDFMSIPVKSVSIYPLFAVHPVSDQPTCTVLLCVISTQYWYNFCQNEKNVKIFSKRIVINKCFYADQKSIPSNFLRSFFLYLS
jgi:hypothetical protein